jgi:hypothetical protein
MPHPSVRCLALTLIIVAGLAMVLVGVAWVLRAPSTALRFVNQSGRPVFDISVSHRGQKIFSATQLAPGSDAAKVVPWASMKPAYLTFRIDATTFKDEDIGIGGEPVPSRLDFVILPGGRFRMEIQHSALSRLKVRMRGLLRWRIGLLY